MASLFLSYAREDEEIASTVAQELTKQGVSVWRDRESLYGGQNWPRALGEAIAANDFMVLLWSSNAATSEFVELEWCTGYALKKTILPCLLDDTPLPPSLAAIHSVTFTNSNASLSLLLQSLRQKTALVEPAQKNAVLHKLSGVQSQESRDILQTAKSLLDQPSVKLEKSLIDKWQTLVVVVVGVLLAITLAIRLPEEMEGLKPEVPGLLEKPTTVNQMLAGLVRNEEGDPLAKVMVSLPHFSQTVTTDALGRFEFQVEAPLEEEIEVMAQKEGFRTERWYATIGNKNLNFLMHRK